MSLGILCNFKLDRAAFEQRKRKGILVMNMKAMKPRDDVFRPKRLVVPFCRISRHGDMPCVMQYAESDRCCDNMPLGLYNR
jgi:hypothetical protein